MKKFTAHDFKFNRVVVYRTAALDGMVEITHLYYPHKRFILVCKDVELPNTKEEEDDK